MPRSNNDTGRAFEYACLNAFSNNFGGKIVESPSSKNARSCYIGVEYKSDYDKGARAASRLIGRLEPTLTYGKGELHLDIQPDSAGMTGDVRDVMCTRPNENWEMGISCKHNHNAVKHSRLSQTIDFGAKWLGMPCSRGYFESIRPIFNRLSALQHQGRAWSEIDDKEASVYIPLLEAFSLEMRGLEKRNPERVPGALVKYLIGTKDFYKVISYDSRQATTVEAFNPNGTLGKSYGNHKPIVAVPTMTLPKRLLDIHIDRVQGQMTNTVEISCDRGWQFSLRIHNAATMVEPSLKFDIRLVAQPASEVSLVEPW